MIKIKDDELIHGYLTRVLSIAGELHQVRDLAGIVSSSGVIRKLPKLNEQKIKYFNYLTPKDIDHMLFNNTPYTYAQTGLTNIVGDYILNGRQLENKRIARTQLRYCIECFKEQIKNHGHIWFRLSWGYSVDCEIHKTRMCHLRQFTQECCHRTVNILDNYKSATSGKCFFCPCTNWEFATDVHLGDWNKKNYHTFWK